MSFHTALAARIAAALAFAVMVAFAAVAAPAWALMLTAVAAAGVCMAAPCVTQRNAPHALVRHWRSGAIGAALVAAVGLTLGLTAGLAAFVVWRAVAEAFAAETMLRDLARRLPPEALERGPMRALQLAAGPIFALAMVFGVHGGVVFGQTLGAIPLIAAVIIAAMAVVVMLDWGIRRLAEWRMGVASRALALHVGAHHLVFVCLGLVGADGAAVVLGLAAWRILRFAPPLPGLDAALPAVRRPMRAASYKSASA